MNQSDHTDENFSTGDSLPLDQTETQSTSGLDAGATVTAFEPTTPVDHNHTTHDTSDHLSAGIETLALDSEPEQDGPTESDGESQVGGDKHNEDEVVSDGEQTDTASSKSSSDDENGE